MESEILKKIIAAVLFIAVCLGIVYAIDWLFNKILKKNNNIYLRFLKSFTKGFTTIFLIYSFLAQFDITKDVSKTLLQSGTILIAMATFATQKVLGNIISGVVISYSKPFNIGDKISLMSGATQVVSGFVMDITTRHVLIRMIDGRVAIVTNDLIDSYICINENTIENNGCPFSMECSFDSDVDMAKEIMEYEINNHELIIKQNEEDIKVNCSALTPNGFELKAIIFTKDVGNSFKACCELRISIFKKWKEAGIEIPYQTITLTK